jgi:hypothetical protein
LWVGRLWEFSPCYALQIDLRDRCVSGDKKSERFFLVNLEPGGAVAVKIIDLGLAKTVTELGSQTLISMPEVFAGTPEFTRQSLKKTPPGVARVGTRKPPSRLAPKKVSVARLPVTGSDIFGREEDIAFLDRAWAKQDVNVVTIVAWAGVGKSTLINHWPATDRC